MSENGHTFVDAVLAGSAGLDDIDDFIDRWHDGPAGMPVHEYLGLTWAEYSQWVDDPASLERAFAARRKLVAGAR